MYITSTGIEDGRIADRFGSKGTQFTENGIPSYSLPVWIHDLPKGTVTSAIIFEDDDAVPVCGFTWIHWTAADIKKTIIDENESIDAKDFVQGVNSWKSCASDLSAEESTGYGGPSPPDRPHLYALKVFALDTELGLKDGFMLNDLKSAMRGHILGEAELLGSYAPK